MKAFLPKRKIREKICLECTAKCYFYLRDGKTSYTLLKELKFPPLDGSLSWMRLYCKHYDPLKAIQLDKMPIETTTHCTIEKEHMDVYGHLNNSYYSRYFEEGREALEREAGIDGQTLKGGGLGFFVTAASYEHKTQLKANQKVEIRSRFLPYERGVSIFIEHEMLLNGKVVATARTSHIFVNLETGKPIRPLEDLIDRIRKP